MSSRPNAVEITAEGLDRIPGSHEGDVFDVKLFTLAADGAGEIAHVLDEQGSTWSLGVGDWRPAPNAVELPAPLERRLELRGDGLDVRTSTDEEGRLEVSLRLDEKNADETLVVYVSVEGRPADLRRVFARALAVVNAVETAADALTLEDPSS